MTEAGRADAPPDPAGGWSRATRRVPGAVVLPPATSALVQACGVLDAQGRFCAASATWRGLRATMVAPAAPPAPVAHLAGRHLWCGQLWSHFGHFLCESLARLWALDVLGNDLPDSLVFVPKRPVTADEAAADPAPGNAVLMRFQRDCLDLLGVTIPVTLIDRPTAVEELIVPGQGFGLGAISTATPEFRAFIGARFAPDVAPEGGERLYLARSALGGREGGALLEERLEENLAREGYEICHPQQHAIADQVARYRAARAVVGLDGSAFHLFAFAGQPGQAGRPDRRAAIILRRNSQVYRPLAAHVGAFTGVPPAIIAALSADWVPEGRGRAGRYSFGQLDFPALAAGLHAAGFIAGSEGWHWPRWREQKAAIAAIEADQGIVLKRLARRAARGRQAPLPAEAAPCA